MGSGRPIEGARNPRRVPGGARSLPTEYLAADGVSAFQSDEERRVELAHDMVGAGLLRGDFVLSSGERSNYYFDKYLFATKPTILRRLASLLADLVPADVDRLAGPELGAVAITAALALETGLPFVIVRRTPKGYGTDRGIEGELHPGERILLVEDVVSTGYQAVRAARHVEAAGASVVRILAVIDREQGAARAATAAGYPLDALYTRGELPL